MVALRADFLPSLFEHAGVFVAFHRDRSGGLGEILRSAVVERLATELARDPAARPRLAQLLALFQAAPAESDAVLAWVGTSGSLAPWRGQRVRWSAALLGGRVDHIRAALRPEPGLPPVTLAEDLELSGRLLSLRWETEVGRRLTAEASFLYLSGAEPPRPATEAGTLGGTYRGFIGVAPFVTETNLFFQGGLSESFASRRASAPGVNGRGVVAPRVSLAWDLRDDLDAEVGAAWLRSDAPGPLGGYGYGTELDLEVGWAPAGWLRLGAEADALFPGDFFAGRRTITKVVLALDLVTP
jgi:hypothetical protein